MIGESGDLFATAKGKALAGSLEELQHEVRIMLADLPRKSQRVAAALLDAPEAVAFGSVREVAARLGVNTATIVRFAQSLGYGGYQAMQAVVRRSYLVRAGLQIPREAVTGTGESSVLAATRDQQRANLELAWQGLNGPQFEAICQAMLDAERVLVVGTGAGLVVGSLLVRLLRHVGLQGQIMQPGGVDLAIQLYDAGPKDLVIGISTWIAFRDVVRAIEIAHRLGARTVALAGSTANALVAAADYSLVSPTQGQPLRFSVVGLVAVVEAIVSRIAEQRPAQVEAHDRALHELYVDEGLMAELPLATNSDKSPEHGP